MQQQVNYGIIGCGMMGREHIRNISMLENAEVTAIFEPDAEMAQRAQKHAPNAYIAQSLDALLNRDDLDCLLIASPNFLHVEHLTEIAKYQHIPLLVEKPLFTSLSQSKALQTFEKQYKAPVWVAMEYRYMPPIQAFIQQVEAATGGIKMLTIREHRYPFLEKVNDWNRFNKYSGGTFVEKCCHFFDLMRLITQSEPVTIMASGAQDVNHLNEQYSEGTPDILDNGYVIVEFENKMRAMLELCMFAEGAKYQEEIWALGPKGKIETHVPAPSRMWPEALGAEPVPRLIKSNRNPKQIELSEVPVPRELLDIGDHNGSTYYQHQKFLNLVRQKTTTPEVTLHDGRMAVLMGLAAQKSITQKRAVNMSELLE